MKLLWILPGSILSNNKRSAVKHYLTLQNRLTKNPEFKAAFSDTINTDRNSRYNRKLETTALWRLELRLIDVYLVINTKKLGEMSFVCNTSRNYEGQPLNHVSSLIRTYCSGDRNPVPSEIFGKQCKHWSQVFAGISLCNVCNMSSFYMARNQSDELPTFKVTPSWKLVNLWQFCLTTYNHRQRGRDSIGL